MTPESAPSVDADPLAPGDWRPASARVTEYLRALGVSVPDELERLREQVREQAMARAATMPLEDPVEAAIEEASALLDRWLTSELGEGTGADTLHAARAAVLGGLVPGWTARWAGSSDAALATAIRAAILTPVPEFAPLSMEPNPIHLCCYRLRRGLAALLYWLAGRAAGADHADHARSHP